MTQSSLSEYFCVRCRSVSHWKDSSCLRSRRSRQWSHRDRIFHRDQTYEWTRDTWDMLLQPTAAYASCLIFLPPTWLIRPFKSSSSRPSLPPCRRGTMTSPNLLLVDAAVSFPDRKRSLARASCIFQRPNLWLISAHGRQMTHAGKSWAFLCQAVSSICNEPRCTPESFLDLSVLCFPVALYSTGY